MALDLHGDWRKKNSARREKVVESIITRIRGALIKQIDENLLQRSAYRFRLFCETQKNQLSLSISARLRHFSLIQCHLRWALASAKTFKKLASFMTDSERT
jgi:hypothetical protein